jgi:hypothetical protein
MKTLAFILKCVAALAVVVFGFWLAAFFKINIGAVLSKLLNGKVNPPPSPRDLDGLPAGSSYFIKNNQNPLRDKTVVELENGAVIQLPKGTIDTDVEKVVVISQGVISVVRKGSPDLTGVFDDASSIRRG